jgi:hypothetical protein
MTLYRPGGTLFDSASEVNPAAMAKTMARNRAAHRAKMGTRHQPDFSSAPLVVPFIPLDYRINHCTVRSSDFGR